MGLILKIAAGILLAMFIAFVVKALITNYAVEQALIQYDAEIQQLKEIKKERGQLLTKQKQLAQNAKQRDSAISREKQAAWSAWYVKPVECEKDQLSDLLVDCVNHRVRARDKFNLLWRKGELRGSYDAPIYLDYSTEDTIFTISKPGKAK